METFDFDAKLKKTLYYMMGGGVLGLLFLLLYPHNQFARLWSNLLVNVYYFTGIGIFGLFAVSAGQIAYGGWQTLEKRILLSLSAFASIGGFLLVAILGLGMLHVHTLYDRAIQIAHPVGAILPKYTTKVVYFNTVFWLGRVLLYAILWFGASKMLNNFFGRTDQTDPKVYKRSKLLCAAFIVIFAVSESAVSWDMIMSLDPGWYSTMFGWYNFASYGCAAWAMTILIVLFLKSRGYLARVNENHVHDLGKLLFGFSILWTYMWFDQFMLQWYANIPEETSFWVNRFDVGYFKCTIFLTLIVNFFFPLFFLIKRGAKRNFKLIGFGACLLIFGHYIDFFNYTFVQCQWNVALMEKKKEENLKLMTGRGDSDSKQVVLAAAGGEKKETASGIQNQKEGAEPVPDAVKMEHNVNEIKDVKEKGIKGGPQGVQGADGAQGVHGEPGEPVEETANYAGVGIGEILVFIGFLGVFLFMFFSNLAKRPISPENDPYLTENEKLEVIYS